jgi:hypothetical protein
MNASETRRTRPAWPVTKITAKTVIPRDIDTQADSGLDPLVGSIAGTAIGSKGEENEGIHEDDAEWQNKGPFWRRAQICDDKQACAYQKAPVTRHKSQNLA